MVHRLYDYATYIAGSSAKKLTAGWWNLGWSRLETWDFSSFSIWLQLEEFWLFWAGGLGRTHASLGWRTWGVGLQMVWVMT